MHLMQHTRLKQESAAFMRKSIPPSGALALIILFLVVFVRAPAGLAQDIVPVSIDEIAPGVFVHTGKMALFAPDNRGDISNSGFVVGNEAVAVIDTGGSRKVGEALLAAIRGKTRLPIRFVINTHMHPDHVFGNAAFEAPGTQFMGHRKLAAALGARIDRYVDANKALLGEAFEGTRIIVPDRGVDGTETIDLGGRRIVVEAHTTAHTDNDLTVFDEQTGTLFAGDLIFVGHTPALDGSIKGWLSLMDALLARELERVVPGHGPIPDDWRASIDKQKSYLAAIASGVRAQIAAGRTLAQAADTVGKEHAADWELFDMFNARNVTSAFAELEWE
jgi:quinoprotein relay system zinc metallohydrolase 2